MTPTRFVAPVPVPTESYVDRLLRIDTEMRKAGRLEWAAFVHEQARMVVRLEGERDDLLPDAVEPADVHADAKAVAYITRVSNGWKH